MSLSTETEEIINEVSAPEQTVSQEQPVSAERFAPPEGEQPLEQEYSGKNGESVKKNAAPVKEEQSIDPRDRDFLAALGMMLESQNRRREAADKPEAAPKENFAFVMVNKGVGVVSLALILVMMGVALICCLFSGAPDFLLPVKLAPVAAILVGLEILIHYFTSGKHFRVHIPSICISAVLVVGCCFMAVTLNKSYSVTKTEYNNRSVAAQIYDSSYKELRYVAEIGSLVVDVDLNPDGTGREKGIEALSTDDIVNITVVLDGSYSSPREFAEECKSVIDGYRILGIPVTEFHFSSENKLNSFRLDVEGKFAQDYSETKLAEQVHHVFVEDFDYIDDLEDFVGYETEETVE